MVSHVDPSLLEGTIADAYGSAIDLSDFYFNEVLTEVKQEAAYAAIRASESTFFQGSRQLRSPYLATETFLRAKQVVTRDTTTAVSLSMQAALSASFRVFITQAMENAEGELREKLDLVAKNFARVANQRVGMKNKMDQVARDAREATLAAFLARVRVSKYRAGQNRLVGAMLHALQREDWAFGTSTGVIFGNTAVLDVEAAHWHRLNFGAGEAGKESLPRNGPMYFSLDPRASGAHGTLITSDFGLRGEAPSPAFTMPTGVFVGDNEGTTVPFGAGRGQAFYTRHWYMEEFRSHLDSKVLPKKLERSFSGPFKGRRKTHFFSPISNEARTVEVGKLLSRGEHPHFTRGIRGYQFMDEGVRSIRSNEGRGLSLPTAYAQLINQWFDDATRAVPKGPLRGAV